MHTILIGIFPGEPGLAGCSLIVRDAKVSFYG